MTRAKPEGSQPHKPAKRGPSLGRVLVVEDDLVLGAALEAELIDGGAREVVICPTTAAAMSALEQAPAQAIILDVHLADRDDGWALAELVDMLGPKRPQIIFSTGAPQDIPPRIAEMGAVFAKPYHPAELVEALRAGRRTGLFARFRAPR